MGTVLVSPVQNDAGEWDAIERKPDQYYFLRNTSIRNRKKELNQLKGGEYTVKTIVTTELIKDIAEKNHIICYDVYTGFKWIADVIRKEGGEKFIGGGEESFGYMPGSIYPGQKDGVSATSSYLAEIAAWVKMQNKTRYLFPQGNLRQIRILTREDDLYRAQRFKRGARDQSHDGRLPPQHPEGKRSIIVRLC